MRYGQAFYESPCFRGMVTVVCLMESGTRFKANKPAHALALALLAAAVTSDCSKWKLPRILAPVTARLDYLIGREHTHYGDLIHEIFDGRQEAVGTLRADLARVRADLAKLADSLGHPLPRKAVTDGT